MISSVVGPWLGELVVGSAFLELLKTLPSKGVGFGFCLELMDGAWLIEERILCHQALLALVLPPLLLCHHVRSLCCSHRGWVYGPLPHLTVLLLSNLLQVQLFLLEEVCISRLLHYDLDAGTCISQWLIYSILEFLYLRVLLAILASLVNQHVWLLTSAAIGWSIFVVALADFRSERGLWVLAEWRLRLHRFVWRGLVTVKGWRLVVDLLTKLTRLVILFLLSALNIQRPLVENLIDNRAWLDQVLEVCKLCRSFFLVWHHWVIHPFLLECLVHDIVFGMRLMPWLRHNHLLTRPFGGRLFVLGQG